MRRYDRGLDSPCDRCRNAPARYGSLCRGCHAAKKRHEGDERYARGGDDLFADRKAG